MADNLITDIKFEACTRRKSLIGFVSFTYKNRFHFTEVGVHERLDLNGIRLVYSHHSYPISRETQREIDKLVTQFLEQQPKTVRTPNENTDTAKTTSAIPEQK